MSQQEELSDKVLSVGTPSEMVESDEEPREKKRKVLPECQICEKCESKYTCPGCSVKYCSLDCFKNHKSTSGCTGKRDVTKYLDVKDFNDNHLKSDYNFLENLDEQTIHWSRMREREKIDSHSYQFHHPKVKEIQYKAIQKGIRMELMPIGMSKRQQNTTYYNRKSDKLFWRVEFLFDQELDDQTNVAITLTENTVCEDVKICDIMAKYFDKDLVGSAKTRDKIQKYASWFERYKTSNSEVSKDAFYYFMKVESKGGNQVLFYNLDATIPLKDTLKDCVVLEYPTIHIVLPGSESSYPTISSEQLSEMNNERDERLKEKKEKRQAFLEKKNKYLERMAEKESEQSNNNRGSGTKRSYEQQGSSDHRVSSYNRGGRGGRGGSQHHNHRGGRGGRGGNNYRSNSSNFERTSRPRDLESTATTSKPNEQEAPVVPTTSTTSQQSQPAQKPSVEPSNEGTTESSSCEVM